jgi:ABC-2 type transport system permease protein
MQQATDNWGGDGEDSEGCAMNAQDRRLHRGSRSIAGRRCSSRSFRQLARDRITFAMIVGIPIIQLTLFGFAINTDPKHMPTAVIAADSSEFTRSLIAAMSTSDYFRILTTYRTRAAAHARSRRAPRSSS